MTEFPVVIFHNPDCGTSRKALTLIRAAGHEPEVVEYLKVGWTREKLASLIARMGVRPRQALRVRGTQAEALGLVAPDATDDAILDAMIDDPALVERPIVETPVGVTLARPAESVLAVLERLYGIEACSPDRDDP